MGDILTEKRERAMKNMERYVAMWKNQCVVRTFALWYKNVTSILGQKRLLRRTIVRMSCAKMVSSFEMWKRMIEHLKRSEYLGLKVLTRLTNIKQSSAFSKWTLHVVRAKVSFVSTSEEVACEQRTNNTRTRARTHMESLDVVLTVALRAALLCRNLNSRQRKRLWKRLPRWMKL